MRNDPVTVSWCIECSLADEVQVRSRLDSLTKLDADWPDTRIAFPGESRETQVQSRRLGDFFEDVKVTRRSCDGDAAFTVTFHRRRPFVDGSWKDLMMSTLRSVREAADSVQVRFDSKQVEPAH